MSERGSSALRGAHAACAYLVVGLGVVHIALSGRTYGEWGSPRALFFVGAGLGIVLLGFMNLVLLYAGGEPRVRRLCHVSNLAGIALFALGVAALPLPQVFALLALMLAQTGTGFAIAAR